MSSLRFLLPLAVALGAAACDRSRPAAAPAPPPPDSSSKVAAAPAAPAAAPAPAPGSPLTLADFVVAGVSDAQDSAELVATAGPPASVRREDNPFQPGDSLATFVYPQMEVLLVSSHVYGVTLSGPHAAATARGLRVGDPEARVHELYGPGSRYEQTLEYSEGEQEGMHVIRVTLAGGKVSEIYLGSVLD